MLGLKLNQGKKWPEPQYTEALKGHHVLGKIEIWYLIRMT